MNYFNVVLILPKNASAQGMHNKHIENKINKKFLKPSCVTSFTKLYRYRLIDRKKDHVEDRRISEIAFQ